MHEKPNVTQLWALAALKANHVLGGIPSSVGNIPGNVQGQAGQGLEQPGVVEEVTPMAMGLDWESFTHNSLDSHMPLTCTGGCTAGMGWSKEVKADMADISTSSLTKMFPCTRVWIKGDGGTVMYVEIC